MDLLVTPGARLAGETAVPGDKSIGHRWLILSSTARGLSRIDDMPASLDVRSTAACLAALFPGVRPGLEAWTANGAPADEPGGSTWNQGRATLRVSPLEVQGEGRDTVSPPSQALDCGNSGTTMRLLSGLVAGLPITATFAGDDSLSTRPMERVATPLREMGATVETTEGHAPVTVRGGGLHAITYRSPLASAQVKSAVLLAALGAAGATTVEMPAQTRDHTERALAALGAPISVEGTSVRLEPFQHDGFQARVPGDPSSAAFIIAAAALTGAEITLRDVGLNPTRLGFLEVMARMGVRTEVRVHGESLGEPVGEIWVGPGSGITGTRVEPEELPLVVDEVPVLAALATAAGEDSRFLGAGELRIKESDRLAGLADGIRMLGGAAAVEGEDLVVAGGGLRGGNVRAKGDHRMAMAFTVAALAATGSSQVHGIEAAAVSFPGFVGVLAGLGADLEVAG